MNMRQIGGLGMKTSGFDIASNIYFNLMLLLRKTTGQVGVRRTLRAEEELTRKE
jgi:hypothetical protein